MASLYGVYMVRMSFFPCCLPCMGEHGSNVLFVSSWVPCMDAHGSHGFFAPFASLYGYPWFLYPLGFLICVWEVHGDFDCVTSSYPIDCLSLYVSVARLFSRCKIKRDNYLTGFVRRDLGRDGHIVVVDGVDLEL